MIPRTKRDILGDSANWMAQAESDLDAAAAMLAAEHPDWASYCAQQAAEKAIKAVRIASGTPVEQMRDTTVGHDIMKLLGTFSQLRSDPSLARVNVLTPLASGARYPDSSGRAPPFKSIEPRQATEAIKIARGVLEYCRRLKGDLEGFWK